jgi:DNA polymerase I-like protein with 3'-5' exonuclease and polymerase domains
LIPDNPNLQNIPIRRGRLSEAFIARVEKLHTLLSADYSQIELQFAALSLRKI